MYRANGEYKHVLMSNDKIMEHMSKQILKETSNETRKEMLPAETRKEMLPAEMRKETLPNEMRKEMRKEMLPVNVGEVPNTYITRAEGIELANKLVMPLSDLIINLNKMVVKLNLKL